MRAYVGVSVWQRRAVCLPVYLFCRPTSIPTQLPHQPTNRTAGVTVRGMVFINPGNPTGQCLSRQDLEGLVRFSHKHKLVLMADEVCVHVFVCVGSLGGVVRGRPSATVGREDKE